MSRDQAQQGPWRKWREVGDGPPVFAEASEDQRANAFEVGFEACGLPKRENAEISA